MLIKLLQQYPNEKEEVKEIYTEQYNLMLQEYPKVSKETKAKVALSTTKMIINTPVEDFLKHMYRF